jgi:hypothetical protein
MKNDSDNFSFFIIHSSFLVSKVFNHAIYQEPLFLFRNCLDLTAVNFPF